MISLGDWFGQNNIDDPWVGKCKITSPFSLLSFGCSTNQNRYADSREFVSIKGSNRAIKYIVSLNEKEFKFFLREGAYPYPTLDVLIPARVKRQPLFIRTIVGRCNQNMLSLLQFVFDTSELATSVIKEYPELFCYFSNFYSDVNVAFEAIRPRMITNVFLSQNIQLDNFSKVDYSLLDKTTFDEISMAANLPNNEEKLHDYFNSNPLLFFEIKRRLEKRKSFTVSDPANGIMKYYDNYLSNNRYIIGKTYAAIASRSIDQYAEVSENNLNNSDAKLLNYYIEVYTKLVHNNKEPVFCYD